MVMAEKDINREIVDTIADGQLSDAQDLIKQGLMKKAGETVDMKRVEQQVNWTDKNELGTEES
mgnify:CR=1 FL=1|jgi:hypothetical protein|tara:strand:- start:132 stop:320 length:189 start_codon:yes stop_codon:yes gene_type:complete